MLPSFPRLKRIEPADRSDIEAITRCFAPSSDFSFGSMFLWNVDESLRAGMLNGNLVVRFKDYQSNELFYSFLGGNRVVDTAVQLIARAKSEGLTPRLRLIAEPVIDAGDWSRADLAIAADPDNYDYVLSVGEWVALPGKRYAGHRAKANKARRRHRLEFVPLDLDSRGTQRAMLDLFDRWADGRPGDEGERASERIAIERLFRPGAATRVSGCAARDGDTMCAFSVWESAPGGRYSIHHFMKTDWAHPGLSSLLVHHRSRLLFSAGYEFANIEQDLGIPGLADYKRSLQPAHFLRKYVIEERSSL